MIIRAWRRGDPLVPYALRVSYRFLGLIYLSSSVTAVAFATARWWMSWLPEGNDIGIGILIFLPFFGWLAISFSFAIAALGWAAWALRSAAGRARRQAWLAVALSTGTATVFGAILSVVSRTP